MGDASRFECEADTFVACITHCAQTSEWCAADERRSDAARPAWLCSREHGPVQVGFADVAIAALGTSHRHPRASDGLPGAGKLA